MDFLETKLNVHPVQSNNNANLLVKDAEKEGKTLEKNYYSFSFVIIFSSYFCVHIILFLSFLSF